MYIILIIQQIIASTTHIVAKDLTSSLNPLLILFIRAFIAASAFVLWIIFRERKFFKIEKVDLLPFIILGALNIPLNQYLFFIGIQRTTAPNIALAYALSPAFVMIISHYFFNQKVKLINSIGITIALVGTFLVLFEHGFSFSSVNFLGDVFGILASFSWAIYTLYGRKFSIKYGAIYTTGWAMILGFILYLPIYLFTSNMADIAKVNLSQFGEIAYLGIITSGVAYILWYYALKKIEANKVAVFSNLQPILTTLLAIIFFQQTITLYFISGGIFIIIGVILTQKESQQKL